MQHLHEAITTEELNGYLDNAAAVVWVARAPMIDSVERWDAVLDHPDNNSEAVLTFLQSVNPAVLDESMLHGGLGVSPGTMALRTLMRLAGADGA